MPMVQRVFTVAAVGLVLASTALVAMSDIFSYVKAVSQGDEIVVQWRTSTEAGIQSFEIERRSQENAEFRRLGRVDAKGSQSIYTYVDNGAFFKPDGGKQFTYRLRAVGSSTQYSPTVTIVHEVSSVKRSWGMIKELFR